MPSRTNGVGVQAEDTRICVVMVGLPARGKSYIAQRGESCRYPRAIPLAVANWSIL
jgi:6-phosphofructo-2-kinase/fructose-2,6-biphosphatase 2